MSCKLSNYTNIIIFIKLGEILPVIKDLTLLDLSYPGTHDTLTYDLSTIVSEGGIDDALILAEILHNYTSVIPGKLL